MQASERFTPVSVRKQGTLARVSSAKSLSPEEAERVRALLRRLVDEYGRGGQTKLAKRLDVGQQSISRVIRAESPEAPGVYIAKKLADALGLTFDAVVSGQSVPRQDSRVEYDERYPNRAVAVEMARKGGLSEHAIEGVQSMALKGADLEILEWFDLIRAEHRQQELGLPPRFPGVPVDPDESPAPKPPPPRKPTKR